MTKLEQLQEKVVDTKAAYRVAYDSADVAFDVAWVAWGAWSKAERELAEYLKEQQDNA